MNAVYHLFIAIFLIVRFNPWIVYKGNPAENSFNQNLAFSAGVYLVISSIFLTYIEVLCWKGKENCKKNCKKKRSRLSYDGGRSRSRFMMLLLITRAAV